MVRVKFLQIITNLGMEDKFIKILRKYDIEDMASIIGRGTASKSILNKFGLDEIKKIIIWAIIPESLEYEICNKIEYLLYSPGSGVATTFKIMAANKFISDRFEDLEVEEGEKMAKCNKSLIVTIVGEGLYEDVLKATKVAGATGGTLIRGRGLQAKQAVKFLGVSIDPEKDIVMTIVDDDNKVNVMNAINEAVLLDTPGAGICFSLPIDATVGLRDIKEIEKEIKKK